MKTLYCITLFCALMFSASIVFAQQTEREKGVEFYNKGEYQKAIETLQKVVEANDQDRKAWLYLGMSQFKAKDKSKPEKAFKAADKISNEENAVDETLTKKVKIISKPRASFTDAARQNQTQGVVKVAVEYGADGTIKTVAAFQTLPDGLTQNCIQAAKGIKFEPATKDGKPSSMIAIVSYSFTIY